MKSEKDVKFEKQRCEFEKQLRIKFVLFCVVAILLILFFANIKGIPRFVISFLSFFGCFVSIRYLSYTLAHSIFIGEIELGLQNQFVFSIRHYAVKPVVDFRVYLEVYEVYGEAKILKDSKIKQMAASDSGKKSGWNLFAKKTWSDTYFEIDQSILDAAIKPLNELRVGIVYTQPLTGHRFSRSKNFTAEQLRKLIKPTIFEENTPPSSQS